MTFSKKNNARADLWKLGIIAPWYLKPYQLDGYALLERERFPYFEWSRRIGKTTTLLVHKIERGLRKEQYVCRWCEPWKYQAREIVIPEMDRINTMAPSTALKYKFYKTDSFYEVPKTGSRIYLRGVNEDRGESSRGPYADDIVADEFGSWRDAMYIVDECLLPQLLSTNGDFAKITTPPKNLGHAHYTEKEKASRENRLSFKTIWDAENELYSTEQIQGLCDAVGGAESVAWRREFLCEPVSDPEMLIIPEWGQLEESLTLRGDYERPAYFDCYVGGDSGFDDNTFIAFGFYDFTNDTVFIEKEYLNNNATSRENIGAAKRIEEDLWGEKKPYRRVYDADKQLIYDIATDLKYPISRPEKHDKKAAINLLRVRIKEGKLKIHESCENLRRQLRVGLWKNEQHKDFERTDGLGHLDGIAALIYFNRSVNTKRNPFPAGLGTSKFTHYTPESMRGGTASEFKELANVFKRK